MEPLLIAAGGLIALIVIVYFYLSRTRVVQVYHVGALAGKELVGKKIFVYGFVTPVYGRAVKISGFGGTIKGRSDIAPAGGNVLEGVFEKDVFRIQRVVKQLPIGWRIEWVNPPSFKKVNKEL